MKYSFGTKDSYNTLYQTVNPKELAERVIEDMQNNTFNRYLGGKSDSVDAQLDFHKLGFHHKKQLIVRGTQEEFQEFEQLIKPHCKFFKPREFVIRFK